MGLDQIDQFFNSTALAWPAGGLLALALLLAGAFHRGRSALAAAVLLILWICAETRNETSPLYGDSALTGQGVEAAMMIAPVAMLLLAFMVEITLFSSRALLVIGSMLLGIVLADALPGNIWDGIWRDERILSEFLRLPGGLPAPGLSGVAGLCALGVFAVRWLLERNPVLIGLGVAALCAVAAGYGLSVGVVPYTALTVAGAALLISSGYASYRMAFLDPLTGLPGRRLLDERLARLGRRYAVAMVDVDHFKKFNDTHGHDVGDQVLKLVAARLRRHFGADAYRYGGEEFSIVFDGGRVAEAAQLCNDFREDVAEQEMVLRGDDRPDKKPKKPSAEDGRAKKQKTVGVTLSIGLAHHGDEPSAFDVVKIADDALYKAKKAGRNRVVEASPA